MTRPDSPGSSTSAASNSTLTPSAPANSITRTNFASTSIPAPASNGQTSALWPWKSNLSSMNSLSQAGPKPAALAACTSTSESTRAGALKTSAAPPSPYRAPSNAAPPLSPLRNGGKKSATASFSITTRTPKTEPPAPPTPSVPFPTPVSPRRFTGTKSPTVIPPISPSSQSPQRFAQFGDPHADMDKAAGIA